MSFVGLLYFWVTSHFPLLPCECKERERESERKRLGWWRVSPCSRGRRGAREAERGRGRPRCFSSGLQVYVVMVTAERRRGSKRRKRKGSGGGVKEGGEEGWVSVSRGSPTAPLREPPSGSGWDNAPGGGRSWQAASSELFKCICLHLLSSHQHGHPSSGPIWNGSRRAVFQLFADLCKYPYRCFLLIMPALRPVLCKNHHGKTKVHLLLLFVLCQKMFFSLLRWVDENNNTKKKLQAATL